MKLEINRNGTYISFLNKNHELIIMSYMHDKFKLELSYDIHNGKDLFSAAPPIGSNNHNLVFKEYA